MKHIHDYKGFLNESGFHGPTNRVTETAKRTKFTGKTAHDLYTQIGGKPKTVFIKNDWYQVNPAELKDDKGDSFIGYTKDGSDFEFYLKDIDFIQESLNEAMIQVSNKSINSNKSKIDTSLIDKLVKQIVPVLNSEHSGTLTKKGYEDVIMAIAKNISGSGALQDPGVMFENDLNEAKEYSFTFNYNTDEDDVEYIQNVLMNAGVDAIAEPGLDSEEMVVKALNAIELRKAKKAVKADGFDINEGVSINKIQSDWTKTTNDMKKEVELWKAADEKDKEKHLKHLKDLTKKKRDLEDALNQAVELKDVDAELVEEKLNVDIVTKKWDELYGEDLKDDYYDIWKKLKAKGSFTLNDLEKMWDAAYGEMFKDQYNGLYKELMNESSVEHINKEDNDKHIQVIDKKMYVILNQTNFEGKGISFLIDKDQIDDLCKTLQKMK
jgi:hypothetical protein